MKTILEPTESFFTEKGSKFINFLNPVSDENQIDTELKKIRGKYPDATHHCFAWRLGLEKLNELANDDGEPSGTAGLPLLNALKSAGLCNILCISVRYYGGTKLGKPGLISAYRQAAEHCIEKAEIREMVHCFRARVRFPYQEQKSIDQLVHNFHLEASHFVYETNVECNITGTCSHKDAVIDYLENLAYREISVTEPELFFGVGP